MLLLVDLRDLSSRCFIFLNFSIASTSTDTIDTRKLISWGQNAYPMHKVTRTILICMRAATVYRNIIIPLNLFKMKRKVK